MKITKSRLREIITEEYKKLNENLKENLGLSNGTKVMYINNKGKLVPAKIKDEVGYDQYQIVDDKGHTEVLKKGKKAKQGAYFQLKEEKLSEDKYPTKKDFEFIADQLVNTWEMLSEKEMVDHLYKETKVNKNQLANAVKEWYKDSSFRRKYEMKPTKDIVRWLETHLVQFNAI